MIKIDNKCMIFCCFKTIAFSFHRVHENISYIYLLCRTLGQYVIKIFMNIDLRNYGPYKYNVCSMNLLKVTIIAIKMVTCGLHDNKKIF